VIGTPIGGVLARTFGITAPFWFGFVGSALLAHRPRQRELSGRVREYGYRTPTPPAKVPAMSKGMRGRVPHPLGVALATNLMILLGILAISLIPAWSLRPIGGNPTLGEYNPAAWSPDGKMFATEAAPRFEVAAADGTILVRDQPGLSPVWLDNRVLLVLREVDRTTKWLVRVDTRDGLREMVGVPIEPGRLVADGRGHVAHRTVGGPTTTTILDPADGTVLARLDGYRAQVWTNDGGLILNQPNSAVSAAYPDNGALSIWRPGQLPQPLASDLVQLEGWPVLAPSGDAFACHCMSTTDGRDPAIYRVPLDGGPPTMMTRWVKGNPHAFPSVAWIDDRTIAVIDRYGVFRVSTGGDRRPVLESPAADLVLRGPVGRIYHFDGAVIVVTKDPRRSHQEAQLNVIDDEGRLRLRRRLDTWNVPYLRIDPIHHRAVVLTAPYDPGENPIRLLMLELS
jgi:hypothetical protein